MFFIHPHYLWLLLLLVPLIWQHRRHRTSLGAVALWGVTALRAVAVAALVVALAQPVLLREDETQTVVHVVDVSAGMDQASLDTVALGVDHAIKKAKKNERHEVVLFAKRPWRLEKVKSIQEEIRLLREEQNQSLLNGSNLAAALDLAATCVPEGAPGEVRLYSDGRATEGNTTAAARDLARRGLSLKTILAGKPLARELILSEVQAAATAMLGETLAVRAVLEATDADVVRLVVTDVTGKEIAERRASISAGRQTLDLNLPMTLPGTSSFEVSVQGEKDTLASNNQKTFAVSVLPAYRVGLIGDGEAAPLAKVLGASSEVETITLEALKHAGASPAANNLLLNYDLIVLADMPAEALGADMTAELVQAVKGGCGLLVTGGRRSFGPGGYLDGPLADLLPVRSVQKMEQRDPSATLVIIIDTSGSMGGARVQLAKEIARLAIKRLKPHDKAGVVEFYGSKRWAAPIQPASNAIDINRALNRLSAGGGTVILPAIEEAYYSLLNVRTRTRHVLVLTDGGVETGAFEPLIRKMADHGITLSTVLVGPGSHSAFLTRLAQWGRGKSYHAPSRFNLPEILIKQPESSLLSPWIERPTQMLPADRSILTDAIGFDHAPLVGGYVETEPRRTADVLIRSTLGHPILARWQYGLGRVATVTTELSGDWSKELAAWDGYGPLMSGLARSLTQRSNCMPIRLTCTVGPEGLTVLAKAASADAKDRSASLELTATTELDETVYHATLEPSRPGQWLARVPLASLMDNTSEHGTVLTLEARTSTGTQASGAVVVNTADEFDAIAPAKEQMATWEQTCSREQAKMKEHDEVAAARAVSPVELRGTMIAVALILFFVQVALRRLLPSRRLGASVSQQSATKAAGVASIMAFMFLALFCSTASAASIQNHRLPEKVVQQVQEAYDVCDMKQARSLLSEAVKKAAPGSGVAAHAARLAWICGDAKTAGELLKPSGQGKTRCREELLFGTLLLETDRPSQAKTHFKNAYNTATTSTDRRFAMAMQVHCARLARQLNILANQWLAKKSLQPEQLRVLVQILGELNRHEDAFRLIERPGLSGDLSEDLQKDVVSLAIDAGKTDRATTVYRRLLQERPGHTPYLSAAARLYLLEGQRREAIKLFDDAIQATDPSRSKSLFHLAAAAADLALYDQARAALDRAAKASDSARVSAVIKKADLARREGNPDEALKLLGSLRSVVNDHPKQLLAVAEAYERYGDRVEAFTLLKRLYELTDSEDILAQVAWLSEESERFDQAYELWLKLWRQTKVTARRNQAKTRLLDLASRTGKLVDMVIDIEEKLDEGRATPEETMLLVDIYSQANDPISASEILYSFGKNFGGELQAAERLVRVYIDCNLFARADSQLRKMIEMDPENKPDYLQQIAMLAVERGRPYEAFVAVEELNALKDANDYAAEFSAGVFELLGMYDEAIAAYEKVFKEQPEHIEILLLWGRVMKQAGRGDEAVERMLQVAKTCEKDDRFVIAIDGLLNLEAKPNVLREALALIERRLAADWNKVFLYELAGDLLDNLGESDRKFRTLQQSLIAAGMRRPTVLRQLMDEAATSGGSGAPNHLVVDYGRTLLMLGDEVPPSVFLQIGKAMLDVGDVKTAATIFRRAGVHGDFATIGRRVAKLYEESNQPRQAEALLHELLITEPGAIDLLIQAGGLSEQTGRFSRAFTSYLKAAERLLDRVPPVIRTRKQAVGDAKSKQRRATNLSELDLYLENATIGLIVSARGKKCEACVLDALSKAVDQELADLKKADLLRSTLDENPRLARRVALLRRIALSLHRPACIAPIDRLLLASYPEDETLRKKTLDTYLTWGLIETASTLAKPLPQASKPQPLQLYHLLKEDEARKKFLADVKRSPVLAERLIPMLLAKGHAEEAKQLLDGLPTAKKRGATAYLMANVLDDPQALADWSAGCTQQPFTDGAKAATGFRKVVEMTWSRLDQASRETLVQQIASAADSVKKNRDKLDMLRLELTIKGDLIPEVVKDEKLLDSVLAQQSRNASELARWLAAMSPQQRIEAVKAAAKLQNGTNRRRYLLELLCKVETLGDVPLLETIADLFKAAPRIQMQEEAAFSLLTRVPWYRLETPAGRAAAAKIAEQLLSDHGAITCVATLHAISTSRVDSAAKSTDQAQAVMLDAISRILSRKKLKYHGQRLLKELITSLPDADLAALEKLLDKQAEQDGMTVSLAFGQAFLYERLGDTKQQLAALQQAFLLQPGDMTGSRGYIDTMQKLGRYAELADALFENLKEASIMQSYQWRTLADLCYQLHRFDDAIAAAKKDDTPLSPLRIIGIEATRKNTEGTLRQLRQFFIQSRKDRRFYAPIWVNRLSRLGMDGYLEKASDSYLIEKRETIFAGLADQPYAVDEWCAMFRAAPPERRDVPALAEGYAKALQLAGKADEMLQTIQAREARGTANQKDRLLWLALQSTDQTKRASSASAARPTPAGFDEILLTLDWTDRRAVTQLARILLTSGKTEEARCLLRWAVALGQWDHRREFRYADAWDPIDMLIETYPENEQPERMLVILKQLAPSPVGGSSSIEFDTVRFQRLLKLAGTMPEVASLLEKEIVTYRQRLTRASSRPSRDALAILVTLEASLGRFDDFRQTLTKALNAKPENIYRSEVWDYRQLLPPATALKQTEQEKYLAEVVKQIEAKHAEGQISQAELVRALCLLASWQRDGKPAKTGALEKKIADLAKQMEADGVFELDPSVTLWLIDHYRQAGNPDEAYRLSMRLLANRTYPPIRFPGLFDEIKKCEGQEKLEKMLETAQSYSGHPMLKKIKPDLRR